MFRWMLAFVVGTILITSNVMAAEKRQAEKPQDYYEIFEKIFSSWTDAFNHGDLTGSCSLFSKNVIASYQGAPQKNYKSICNGFKKIFQGVRDYQYNFKLQQVYQSDELATVRVTWYLRIYEQDKLISETQDEGLDVFKKNKEGEWKIVNYLAYPENKV